KSSRHRPTGECKRKVIWRDDHPDTIRFHHAAIARTETRQRIIGQSVIEAVLSDKIISVEIEKVRRLLHLSERFHPVLTHFQRQSCSNVINAFFDQHCDPLEQAHTLDHRYCAPAWKGSLRGRHRIVRISDTGEWEVAEDPALVNRTAPRVMPGAVAVLAIDIKAMGGPQRAIDFSQRGVKSPVHVRRRLEHGCVSKFETHVDSSSLSRRSSKARASVSSRSSIT